jgi:hypothetical protein
MSYKYRGTVRDVKEQVPTRATKLEGFDPSACGTYAGYRRHQKHRVPACQDCLEAQSAYSRDYYERTKDRPRKTVFTPNLCGTYSGYRKHIITSVKPCAACLVAHADYMNAYRAGRKKQRQVAA